MGRVRRINQQSLSDMAEEIQTPNDGSQAPSGRVHPLVRRIASMGEADIQSAIDSNHPALDESTHDHLEADELAMRLIHGRHGKREIVNLLRWVMMGAPNAPAMPTASDGRPLT